MNRQQMASVACACVLLFSGLDPAPVWAQVAPAIERNLAAAGTSTVAVLPFANISGQPQDDWIGAGIAESVLADLETRNIAVIGPTALLAEAQREGTDLAVERNAIALSQRLGAAWLVTGGYQHLGYLLRITGRVVDVRTGAVMSTVKVDGQREDLFELQDRIVAELALRAPLTGGVTDGQGAATVAGPSAGHSDSSALLAPTNRTFDVLPPTATAPPTVAAFELPTGYAGPLPPVAPEVVSRDPQGRMTLRAVRLDTPLQLDGQLDERVYQTVPPVTDFVQQEPDEGAPATEHTDIWVMFDSDHVYVSFRCLESDPARMIVNEMRRDNSGVFRNDNVAFILDTFYDRRNGVEFVVNPMGGRMDGQITDERLYNGDWNPIWDVEVDRFEGGWSVEAAIPFKSLRYRRGQVQVWGFNARRVNAWKNEHSFLMGVPSAMGGRGIFQLSRAATLVGLEVPTGSKNLDIKPYAITDLTSDRTVTPQVLSDFGGDVGLDVKYGVTENLVADLTVRTDFAQVEADEQQVNLTRFSLFFPEKREFFLENRGTFVFGGARRAGARGGGTDVPVLFYSREIGLERGYEVPMDAGGRVTGRVGRYSLGFMGIRTGEVPIIGSRSTNFTVVRVRRDILRRSNVGLLFTGRSVSKSGAGSSETYGVDGIFSFYDNLNINTYWAKTSVPGVRGDDASYRVQLDYDGDRYGVQAERLVVGGDFRPEVGFIRRDNFDRRFGLLRFSPRPARIAAVRKFTFQGQVAYVMERAGALETRENQGQFGIEFQNSDTFNLTYSDSYEFLRQPFQIAPSVAIPVGGYTFQDTQVSFGFGRQRVLAGTVSLQHGSFFSGEKTTIGFSRGRLELTPQLSVEPSVSYNRVDLPEGRFTTNLATTRTTFTVTPEMFVTALLQYNSSTRSLSTNLRMRWEYQPGSELFVVYNEQRDTLTPRFPELKNRAFVVKINRLFRF
jgi:TolB-like protein